jgi:hypothetical protein
MNPSGNPISGHRPPAGRQRRDWLLAAVISLGVALAIVAPFVWLGNASGHDISFHASSWVDAAGQWQEGILFPRWTEWANYGYGEPRFIFYPPLSWLLGGALVNLLPINMVAGVFVVLAQTFAGVSAFALARGFANRKGALLGAACFAANPNALLITYVRSDYAELLAIAFYPLMLLAALRLCGWLREAGATSGREIGLFGATFAAVWLTNAPAGVIAAYSAALLFAWAAATGRTWKPLARGTAGIALGFGLSSLYIIPAAYEQRWVNITQALSSGLAPADNFLFTTINDPDHNHFNRVASLIAALTFALTVAFAMRARTKRPANGQEADEDSRAWRGLLVLGAAASLLMLSVTEPLWKILPELRFVQFPWRWMSMLTAVFCVCAARGMAGSKKTWTWASALFLVLAGTAVYLGKNTWWDADDFPSIQYSVEQGQGFEGTDEYDPLGDDHLDLPQNQPEAQFVVAGKTGNGKPETGIAVEGWTAEERRIRVEAQHPVKLAVRTLDYPAWQVTVNGVRVKPEGYETTRRMILPLKAGTSEIEIRFVRTRDRTAGGAVSLASLLLSGILWIGAKRPRSS